MKSLVEEEGEGHCSQEEQQHVQGARAGTSATLIRVERGVGAGSRGDVRGPGQGQVMGVPCALLRVRVNSVAVRSVASP